MQLSTLLTSVYRYLHLPSSSTDIRNVLLEIYNSTLNTLVPKRVDYLKAEISLTVPAKIQVIPTRLTDYTIGLTVNPATETGIKYTLHASSLGYIGRVLLQQNDTPLTSECTLTMDTPVGAFPATTSDLCACGVDLVALHAPQNINGTISYDMHPHAVYAVYVDGALTPALNEYYTSTVQGALIAYNYAAPILHFSNPVTDSHQLTIKCFRMPKQITVSNYTGNEIVDWPQGWEQYLILLMVRQWALQERDANLVAMYADTIAEQAKAFIAEQNTLSGNLYNYNLRPGLRGRSDRMK